MRLHAFFPLLAIAWAATAADAGFISIPPLLAPVPQYSRVHARSVSCWPGGILLAGFRMPDARDTLHGTESEHWLAEVHGAEVRELAWPPPYLNVPDLDEVRACGAVGARVAVVAGGGRGARRVSRLLLWDGREWEMFPPVNGNISSIVEHDGRLVIGGHFPVNETTALHALLLSGGEWLPFGGGLPLARITVQLMPWRDMLVAVGRPWGRPPAAVTCLWLWRQGSWAPLGPMLEFVWGTLINAVVWNDRLVVGGSITWDDGTPARGLYLLAEDGTVSVPPAFAEPARPELQRSAPLGVWDGRLVLTTWPVMGERAYLLLFDGGGLWPMPRLPSAGSSGFWPDSYSACDRELALLSYGGFKPAGSPQATPAGRQPLACWRDGSWWVPSLAALEE